jgi:hypothetical protein
VGRVYRVFGKATERLCKHFQTAFWDNLFSRMGAKHSKHETACFSRVGEKCEYDYSVTFSDIQRLHLLKQSLSRAESDLNKSERIANEYLAWCKEMIASGVTDFKESETFEGLGQYRRRIEVHQLSTANILRRLDETAELVNSSSMQSLCIF